MQVELLNPLYSDGVLALLVVEEGDLGKDLVGEGAGHDERRVSVGASQVNETSLSEKNDVSSVLHGVSVDLGLDVDLLGGVGLEPCDIDFDVEVTNVADDGVLLHDLKVLGGDDVSASGGGDEDIGLGSSLLHDGNFVPGHSSLEGVNGVDLGNDDTGTIGSERLGALWAKSAESMQKPKTKRTPLPTSPKPATTATFPANMMSVARLIPSTSDSRHP